MCSRNTQCGKIVEFSSREILWKEKPSRMKKRSAGRHKIHLLFMYNVRRWFINSPSVLAATFLFFFTSLHLWERERELPSAPKTHTCTPRVKKKKLERFMVKLNFWQKILLYLAPLFLSQLFPYLPHTHCVAPIIQHRPPRKRPQPCVPLPILYIHTYISHAEHISLTRHGKHHPLKEFPASTKN